MARKRALLHFYNASAQNAADGKKIELKPIPLMTICKWASEWAVEHAGLDLMRRMIYEHLPPLLNEDGTTRQECRKQAILKCFEECKLLPASPQATPNARKWCEVVLIVCNLFECMYAHVQLSRTCPKCSHTCASCTNAAKNHEKSDVKCIVNFQVPFSPRPCGSMFNYTTSPVGRFIEFVHADDGRVCRGVFREKMGNEPYEFKMAFKHTDEQKLNVFEGDHRNLHHIMPKWLTKQ